MLRSLLTLTFLGIVRSVPSHSDFGYDEKTGPTHWGGICESGHRQSPVDINSRDMEVAVLPTVKFINYDKFGEITLKNNGHTVVGKGFDKWGDDRPFVTGGGLNGTYELAQFHFHWSQYNDTGSEHTLSSLHFPAELHLVHTRRNVESETGDAIAVVAVFMALGDNDNALHDLTPYFHSLRKLESEITVKGISMKSMLPSETNAFYRYEGSLTTPGCDETVVWTVMADPIIITPQQLHALREVSFSWGMPLRNFRPVQPLHGRKILYRPAMFSMKNDGSLNNEAVELLAALIMYILFGMI